MELETRTDQQIDQQIENHERKGATDRPLYRELLEERARRADVRRDLKLEKSLDHLKRKAMEQQFTTYGELAAASGVEWSKARRQMNGAGGHLDLLLDICHARKLPLLTAICVNKEGVNRGELSEAALQGFVKGALRLGVSVGNDVAFHQQCKAECFEWGKRQGG